MMKYDKIIIGAGIYGLYSALYCGKNNEKVLVLEKDSGAFKGATYINQARVHMGYHYPRSFSTAIKSAGYFERFNKDYDFQFYMILIKYMLHLVIFLGQMQSNFKNFVIMQTLNVIKFLLINILKKACVMVLF